MQISGRQIELGDALREHVRTSLDAIGTKYFDDPISMRVTFSRVGTAIHCDVECHPDGGVLVQAKAEAHDAHKAFDEASEHLAKQLRRHRRKAKNHGRDTLIDGEEAGAA